MAFLDYSSHWILDQFLTFLEMNQMGTNDKHLYDTIAIEHNINTATIDGTHKSNSILGSYINKNPISTGSQIIGLGSTWTPALSGVYQVSIPTSGFTDRLSFEIYVSGAWRESKYDVSYGVFFFDGSNMRFNNIAGSGRTMYYQKF